FLPGATSSVAYSTNADGTVIVGCSGFGGCGNGPAAGNQAFRWTQVGGMAGLGFLPGGSLSRALGANADGSVVVGDANFTGSGCGGGLNTQAFRWTQAGGMVGLGFLPGDIASSAEAVNADGSVVVGSSSNLSTNPHGWRWTQATGLVAIGVLPGGFDF